jgi:anti-sigma factor RsiW
MNCQTAYEHMSAALDGELSADEADALRAHLQGCETCRGQRRRLTATDRTLRGRELRDVRVPPRLRARIEEIAGAPIPTGPPARWPRTVGLLVAGAALGALGVLWLRAPEEADFSTEAPATESRTQAGPRLSSRARAPGAEGTTSAEEPLASAQVAGDGVTGAGKSTPGAAPTTGARAAASAGTASAPSAGAKRGAQSNGAAPSADDSSELLGVLFAASSAAAKAATGPGAGSLRGVVELEGSPPAPGIPPSDLAESVREVSPRRSPILAERFCGGEVSLFRVRDGDKLRRLADVHVSVLAPAPILAGNRLPQLPVPVGNCAVLPRVIGAYVDQPIHSHATDNKLHPLEAILPEPHSGIDVPALTQRLSFKKGLGLPRPGTYALRCAQHDGERAHVVVSDSPFFAVTGEDGAFTIAGVPPGRHRLRVWHEGLEDHHDEVDIRPGEMTTLRVRLSLPAPPQVAAAPAPAVAPPTAPERPAEEVQVRALEVVPPCRHATSGESPIARACASGGLPAAHAAMRTLVRDIRRQRGRLDCHSCHLDRTTFDLRPDARVRLQQVLGLLGRR